MNFKSLTLTIVQPMTNTGNAAAQDRQSASAVQPTTALVRSTKIEIKVQQLIILQSAEELTDQSRTKMRKLLSKLLVGITMVNLIPEHLDVWQEGPKIIRGTTNTRSIDMGQFKKWQYNIIGQDGKLKRNIREYAVSIVGRASQLKNLRDIQLQVDDETIVIAEWTEEARGERYEMVNGNHRREYLRQNNLATITKRNGYADIIGGLKKQQAKAPLSDDQNLALDCAIVSIGAVNGSLGRKLLFPAKIYDLGE